MSRRRGSHSWFCRNCERGMTSDTPGERWGNLCASCDPRTEDERRKGAREWFDKRYPPKPRRFPRVHVPDRSLDERRFDRLAYNPRAKPGDVDYRPGPDWPPSLNELRWAK